MKIIKNIYFLSRYKDTQIPNSALSKVLTKGWHEKGMKNDEDKQQSNWMAKTAEKSKFSPQNCTSISPIHFDLFWMETDGTTLRDTPPKLILKIFSQINDLFSHISPQSGVCDSTKFPSFPPSMFIFLAQIWDDIVDDA